MRSPTDTACLFFKAMADAGADGVYIVDSRGNSTPLATRVYISRIRAGGGREVRRLRAAPQRPGRRDRERDGGGRRRRELDRRIGDRHRRPRRLRGAGRSGGAVRDVRDRNRHQARRLYELCRYVQDAYGIELPPWKPIVGENWNKEEGVGHLEGSANAEATIGIAPRGRRPRVRSGDRRQDPFRPRAQQRAHRRSRCCCASSCATGATRREEQFQTVLFRARAAVATNYGRHYLTFDEFRAICEGVMLAGYEARR